MKTLILVVLCAFLSECNNTRSYEIVSYQTFNESVPSYGLQKEERVSPNKLVCFYIFTKMFSPSIMDGLCTHINVGLFSINTKNNTLSISEEQEQDLHQIISLKQKAKDLKIIISVGGAGDGSFSSMVRNHTTRKIFIRSCINVIKKFRLDGIDLDWEWPVVEDGNPKEKVKFIQLLHEFREEFNRHKKKYILSADVASAISIIELGYYVNYIADHVDYVNVMCYDYNFFTKFYPFTGHNAPLYSARNGIFSKSINESIYFWISSSMPREKIVLGIPTYGHTFELVHSYQNSLHAPAKGFGLIGNNGFAHYPQICDFLTQEEATVVYDEVSKVPYAYCFREWISYDDEGSLAIKISMAGMINCPYNMSHVILKSRMAAHLVKCRQKYPVDSFETCPFNSSHDVPAPELQYHIESCPDRKQLDSVMYILDEPRKQDSPVNIELPGTSENWDEEPECYGSYLNIKDRELEKQMVFRQPVGMSKSEKKTFFHNEIHRFEQVSDESRMGAFK